MTPSQFTPDSSHVIDPTGKRWPTGKWHETPSPWKETGGHPFGFLGTSAHWFVAPQPPKALTQEDRDNEALQQAWKDTDWRSSASTAFNIAWSAALSYARSTPTVITSEDGVDKSCSDSWLNYSSIQGRTNAEEAHNVGFKTGFCYGIHASAPTSLKTDDELFEECYKECFAEVSISKPWLRTKFDSILAVIRKETR